MWSPRCGKARLGLCLTSCTILVHWLIPTLKICCCYIFFSWWSKIFSPPPISFCNSKLLSRCRCCLQISMCVLFSRSWSKLINRSYLTDVCFTRLECKLLQLPNKRLFWISLRMTWRKIDWIFKKLVRNTAFPCPCTRISSHCVTSTTVSLKWLQIMVVRLTTNT